jgi:hypothetical protein
MRALDGVSTRSLAVSGVDLLHRSNAMDLRMGTVQGIKFLGQFTGRWRFDEEAFSGRLWMFFLGGAGEGKRSSRARFAEKFSQNGGPQTGPVCVIYYMLSSGGFTVACVQAIAKGGSSLLGRPGQTRALFGFDNPST